MILYDLRVGLILVLLNGLLLGFCVGRALGADPVCDIRVESVVDGDTFKAPGLTVLSPTMFFPESVGFRLLEVFAPERGEEGYFKAKADLSELVAGKFVAIVLPPQGRIRDRYGRLLVIVRVCGPALDVNAEMRARGWTDSGKGVKR